MSLWNKGFLLVLERVFEYDLCMFEELAQAIRNLDIPVESSSLAAVLALRDELDASITKALGDFDDECLWALDGAFSMAGWLKAHTGVSGGRAGGMTAAARRLH